MGTLLFCSSASKAIIHHADDDASLFHPAGALEMYFIKATT